eukprot:TRINITY_DN37578_c0_g1_i1.p1 TRINITY_DN37578_c0_g1~~TRINITY_DN37578_c0_g1_i1.p1  ORF type:complete len:292 (+),score=62.28 TRINITY_DN37578_c0_g1_i1:81-878(+)
MSPSHRLSTPFQRADSEPNLESRHRKERKDRHRRHGSSSGPRVSSKRAPRELVEALPALEHLSRPRLERLDMQRELDAYQAAEDKRYSKSLVTAPLGMVERKCPYGAPLPDSTSGLMLRRRADRAALLRAQAAAEEMEKKKAQEPKKRPGIQPIEIPYDPTTLHNEHEARGAYLDTQIVKQQEYVRSRSEATLQNFEVKAPEFHFDHLPPGVEISEAQSQYFPRSTKIVKDIGCGKDPRFCRPWGDYEKHREMLFMQSAAMSGKK